MRPEDINPVLIDDRAGSKELHTIDPISAISHLARLNSGDVFIVGNGPNDTTLKIGVELKSPLDFISSLHTGRLTGTQIPRMREDYDILWVLIYGKTRETPTRHLEYYHPGDDTRPPRWVGVRLTGTTLTRYSYFQSSIFSLTASGVHCDRVPSYEMAADWIYRLAAWWSKSWSSHRLMNKIDNSRSPSPPDKAINLFTSPRDTLRDLRAQIASKLSSIGEKRAYLVADHFPSVRAMISAPAEEWVKIPGIGKTIAKAVVKEIQSGG